jgi:polynucleotide 5'-kinase involved in rRNA processing
MVRTTIQTERGNFTIEGRFVPEERDTGTPAHFEIESARLNEREEELSDSELNEAIDALFEARAELLGEAP